MKGKLRTPGSIWDAPSARRSVPLSSVNLLRSRLVAMPPLKQVNAGQLIAYIDRWWDLRRNLQARLEKSVPEIQARARRTNDIALRILREHQERREAEAGRRSRG